MMKECLAYCLMLRVISGRLLQFVLLITTVLLFAGLLWAQAILLDQHLSIAGGAINDDCPWCIEYRDDQPEVYDAYFEFLSSCFVSDRYFFADLLWMKTIYYFGQESLGNGDFERMFHCLDTVISADPEWQLPYWYGALILPFFADDPQGGYDIAKRGVLRFENDWEMLFIKGYIEWKFQGDFDMASQSLYHAAKAPGSPKYLIYLAATLSKKSSQESLTEMIVRGGVQELATDEEIKILLEKLEE